MHAYRIDYIEFIPLSGGGDPDNLPPYVVGEVPDQSLLQTEELNLDLNNYVFDPEEDALTYTVEAVDPVDADVSWITVVDGVLGGTPGATGVGVTEIKVIVNDGANVIEIPLTIEVDKVNTPPETTGIANQILTEDQAFARRSIMRRHKGGIIAATAMTGTARGSMGMSGSKRSAG